MKFAGSQGEAWALKIGKGSEMLYLEVLNLSQGDKASPSITKKKN